MMRKDGKPKTSKSAERRGPRRTVQPSAASAQADRGVAIDQHQRFLETARALQCDEDRERFEEKLKQIAAAKLRPSKARPAKKS